MSFEVITNTRLIGPRCTVGLKQKNVRFLLNGQLIARLGWEKVRSISVSVGKDDDAGCVWIAPGAGFALYTWSGLRAGRRFEMRSSALPEVPRLLPSTECPISWFPSIKGLLIYLPWVENQMAPLREIFEAAS